MHFESSIKTNLRCSQTYSAKLTANKKPSTAKSQQLKSLLLYVSSLAQSRHKMTIYIMKFKNLFKQKNC